MSSAGKARNNSRKPTSGARSSFYSGGRKVYSCTRRNIGVWRNATRSEGLLLQELFHALGGIGERLAKGPLTGPVARERLGLEPVDRECVGLRCDDADMASHYGRLFGIGQFTGSSTPLQARAIGL